MTQLPPPPKVFKPLPEKKEEEEKEENKDQKPEVIKDSFGRTIKKPEVIDDKGIVKDSFGKEIKKVEK